MSKKTNLNIASVQMVSTPDLEQNLSTATRLIKEAANEGAQLVVLPEYFCMMGLKDTDKVRIREPLDSGPIQDTLARIAQETQIHLEIGRAHV